MIFENVKRSVKLLGYFNISNNYCPPPKAGFPCSPRTKLWLGLYWEKPRVEALTSSSFSAAQTGLTGVRISFICCYCNLSGDVWSFCLLRSRCLMGLNGIMWLVKTGLSRKVSYVRFFDHPIRFRFDRTLSQKRIMACITQQRDQDLQVVWQPEK